MIKPRKRVNHSMEFMGRLAVLVPAESVAEDRFAVDDNSVSMLTGRATLADFKAAFADHAALLSASHSWKRCSQSESPSFPQKCP